MSLGKNKDLPFNEVMTDLKYVALVYFAYLRILIFARYSYRLYDMSREIHKASKEMYMEMKNVTLKGALDVDVDDLEMNDFIIPKVRC